MRNAWLELVVPDVKTRPLPTLMEFLAMFPPIFYIVFGFAAAVLVWMGLDIYRPWKHLRWRWR